MVIYCFFSNFVGRILGLRLRSICTSPKQQTTTNQSIIHCSIPTKTPKLYLTLRRFFARGIVAEPPSSRVAAAKVMERIARRERGRSAPLVRVARWCISLRSMHPTGVALHYCHSGRSEAQTRNLGAAGAGACGSWVPALRPAGFGRNDS